MADGKETPPTRHSTREGKRRMNALIDMYGPTMDDDGDADFTPMPKRARTDAEDNPSTEESPRTVETAGSATKESLEPISPMVLIQSRSAEIAEDAAPEVENPPARTGRPSTRGKARKSLIRTPRAKKAVAQTTKPQRRQSGQAADRSKPAQPSKKEASEHQPNTSQVLSHRLKAASRPNANQRSSHDSSQTIAAEPGLQLETSIGRAIPRAERAEVEPSLIREEFLQLENEFLKEKLKILRSKSRTEEAELLEAENAYLTKKSKLAREKYPAIQDLRKHELAFLKNTYLKSLLELYPNMD